MKSSALTEIIENAKKNTDWLKNDGEIIDCGDHGISFDAVPKALKAAYIAAKYAKDEQQVQALQNELNDLTIIYPKDPETGFYGLGFPLGSIKNIINQDSEQ